MTGEDGEVTGILVDGVEVTTGAKLGDPHPSAVLDSVRAFLGYRGQPIMIGRESRDGRKSRTARSLLSSSTVA